MWIFARGESRKAQESVRRAREGHFGYILTVQLSQARFYPSPPIHLDSLYCGSGRVRSETLLLLREGELFAN